jgi:hypothetical protein
LKPIKTKKMKMKKKSPGNAIFFITAMAIIGALSTGCQKEIKQEQNNTDALVSKNSKEAGFFENPNIVHIPLFIEDANMKPPVGNNTLLYDNRGHTRVLAPDGHQVTLGEFNSVSGYADVKCVNAGTHAVFHLTGLIPNGVYTFWVVTFKSPGFDPTFANQIGEGALGAPDGSQNSFTATSTGTGSLSAIMPAGPLSEFGSVGNCLSSEFEVHLVGAYHIDNLTHGGNPGADLSTWVPQFAFPFKGGF